MLLLNIIALAFLLLGRAQTDNQDCISREEFESQIQSQQREIDSFQTEISSLQRELNYWQNTTIDILKKYLIDNNGDESNRCTVEDDSYLKDGIEELNQKIGVIFNQTQDVDSRLLSVEDKIESQGTGINTQLSSVNSRLSGVEGKIERMEQEMSHPPLGSFLNPAPACKSIPQGSQSGHYWIQNAGTGYANLEHCDMTRRCCNSTGGWMRVAHLDMTDPNQHCPSGFRLITTPKRTCGTPGSRCVSTTFPLNGVKYSRVCGKIIGYQVASPDAFKPYYSNRGFTIDNQYVDGVSLTHGQTPRKHIWTFAAVLDEVHSNRYVCPCTKTDASYTGVVPPFIGQDYFCDTGSRYHWQQRFYHADPLWDGSGCGPTSSCCGFNNPPWFCKQLPQPTTDDIELRVCLNQASNDEDVALEMIEVYVQ